MDLCHMCIIVDGSYWSIIISQSGDDYEPIDTLMAERNNLCGFLSSQYSEKMVLASLMRESFAHQGRLLRFPRHI